jgi:excisionase family DNA binding protein
MKKEENMLIEENYHRNEKEPEFVSIKTLSILLDIPERTLRTWVYKRKIPYYKVGKLVRFDLSKIRTWTMANPIKPLEGRFYYDAKAY